MKKLFFFLITIVFILYGCSGSDENIISVKGVRLFGLEDGFVPGYEAIGKGDTIPINIEIFPYNATDKRVTWLSNNPDVVTVNQNGLVTGINTGTTSIVVKTNDGGYTASWNFIVPPDKTAFYGTWKAPESQIWGPYTVTIGPTGYKQIQTDENEWGTGYRRWEFSINDIDWKAEYYSSSYYYPYPPDINFPSGYEINSYISHIDYYETVYNSGEKHEILAGKEYGIRIFLHRNNNQFLFYENGWGMTGRTFTRQ